MRISSRRPEAAQVPRFYGLAYRDHAQAEIVCHAIPLNLIVHAWVLWRTRRSALASGRSVRLHRIAWVTRVVAFAGGAVAVALALVGVLWTRP